MKTSSTSLPRGVVLLMVTFLATNIVSAQGYEWNITKSRTPATWNLLEGDTGISQYTLIVTRTGEPNGAALVPAPDAMVDVIDDNGTPGDPSDDRSWTFEGNATTIFANQFVCDADSGSHTNTAIVVGKDSGNTLAVDSATVVVNCWNLDARKDAQTTFTREYDWDIAKVAFALGDVGGTPIDSLILPPDGTPYTVVYVVSVDTVGHSDSGWAVSGSINISNSTPVDAELTDLADVITPGPIDGQPDCGVTFPFSLLAGESLTCSYAADLPDGSGRTNTGTATFRNFDYNSRMDGTPAGTTDFSASANVVFGGPTTVLDACTDVTDANAPDPNLGQVCIDEDLPKRFMYSFNIDPTTEDCPELIIQNTAAQTEQDTGESTDDSWTITVEVACPEGCTLTQGYWKTHNASFHGGASAMADEAWCMIGDWSGPFDAMGWPTDPSPNCENDPFFLSGDSWFNVLWTPPKGNPYYILAHQWMAAYLNMLNEASVPAEVENALVAARDYLSSYGPSNTPRGRDAKTIKAQVHEWASLLASYNEGREGVDHCDELDLTAPAFADIQAKSSEGGSDFDTEEAAVGFGLDHSSAEIPTAFAVENYPNPFNPTTTLIVELPEAVDVRIDVYDGLGRKLEVLAEGRFDAGTHRFNWNAGSLPSGQYYYQLWSSKFVHAGSLMLLK